MEKYLTTVIDQLRCKEVRPYVEKELRDHIEDQIEHNVSKGMKQEDAEKAAVKDMGDPVETGELLDKIHSTKMAWEVVVLTAVITIAAIIFHSNIWIKQEEPLELFGASSYLMGFGIMLLFYYVDYTFVARFSKVIAVLLMAICFCYRMFGDNIYRFPCPMFALFKSVAVIDSLMLMYIPVFACILYKYRNTGVKGLIKSVIWMAVPTWYMLYKVGTFGTCLTLFISMLVLISMAISQGWFTVNKRISISVLLGTFVGIPLVSTAIEYLAGMLPEYKMIWIDTIFKSIGKADTTAVVIRDLLCASKMTGKTAMNVANILPDFDSDNVLAYISSQFGLSVGLLVICVVAFLLSIMLGISLRQKNQLGRMIGVGVSMVLICNAVLNVLIITGGFPRMSTFFPLISLSESNIIVTYALIGIVLSIYKYKSIYPKYVNVAFPKVSIEFKFNIKEQD